MFIFAVPKFEAIFPANEDSEAKIKDFCKTLVFEGTFKGVVKIHTIEEGFRSRTFETPKMSNGEKLLFTISF